MASDRDDDIKAAAGFVGVLVAGILGARHLSKRRKKKRQHGSAQHELQEPASVVEPEPELEEEESVASTTSNEEEEYPNYCRVHGWTDKEVQGGVCIDCL